MATVTTMRVLSFCIAGNALRGVCPRPLRASILGVDFDRRTFNGRVLMSAIRWLGALATAMTLTACGATQASLGAAGGSPSTIAAKGKGGPVRPEDFPGAPQSLVFEGPVSAQVTYGRPSSCGSGSGPTGPMVFGYGVYFQSGDHWFLFNATTSGSAKAYTGPGSYPARARLSVVGPNGPSNLGYQGEITLQIAQDTTPDTGAVAGQLSDDQGHIENVSGGWTCTRGPLLGPG